MVCGISWSPLSLGTLCRPSAALKLAALVSSSNSASRISAPTSDFLRRPSAFGSSDGNTSSAAVSNRPTSFCPSDFTARTSSALLLAFGVSAVSSSEPVRGFLAAGARSAADDCFRTGEGVCTADEPAVREIPFGAM